MIYYGDSAIVNIAFVLVLSHAVIFSIIRDVNLSISLILSLIHTRTRLYLYLYHHHHHLRSIHNPSQFINLSIHPSIHNINYNPSTNQDYTNQDQCTAHNAKQWASAVSPTTPTGPTTWQSSTRYVLKPTKNPTPFYLAMVTYLNRVLSPHPPILHQRPNDTTPYGKTPTQNQATYSASSPENSPPSHPATPRPPAYQSNSPFSPNRKMFPNSITRWTHSNVL